MAAEYSANDLQTVLPSASVIFTASPVPCNRGLIYHRDESGLFRLASPSLINGGYGYNRGCCCCGIPTALYQVAFHCNISLPTEPAGTVEPISLALAIDGEIDPSSIMTVTVPLVSDTAGDNVGSDIIVAVPCICRCSSVSVRNISTQPVNVLNANIVFNFAGIRRMGRGEL